MPEAAAVETAAAPESAIVSTADTVEVPAEKVENEAGKDTAESAPAEGEESPKEEQPDPERDKRRESRRVERKIGNAIKQAAEQRARAEMLAQELERFKAAAQPVADGEPNLEDFADLNEYKAAVIEYAKKSASKEYEAKQQQEATTRAQQEMLSGWEARVERGHDKYDDFAEIVGDLKPTTPWGIALMKTENGDDVAYYLGKNIAEAHRINKLDPASQFLEIGRLSAKLELQPKEARKPSAAPAPIKTVGATNSPSSKKLIDLSQDEFEKRRKAQIAQRR